MTNFLLYFPRYTKTPLVYTPRINPLLRWKRANKSGRAAAVFSTCQRSVAGESPAYGYSLPVSISKRAHDISFGTTTKKSGEASNTGRSNSQEAKLKACNVITAYQPRLILIWFLNSCVIKTAKRTASGERRRRGGKKRHFTNA